MKHFFYVLFGGISIIAVGISISYVGALAWRLLIPQAAQFDFPSISAMASSAGLLRTVRYTADEEEDLINGAARALPSGADGRISATAYIVKDLKTGGISAAYNADRSQPIASLTKLVTAVLARRLIQPDTRITLTAEAVNIYGNTAQFKIGETFAAEDLLYPLLMVSSNDAAEALARNYGRTKFIKAMNEFAQSVGAYRTYFADPSGLSPLNVSSAGDLTLILDWIRLNDPGVIELTNIKAKTARSHTWVNPTHFLNWSNYIGGKNGYTDEADRTAAALFRLGPEKDPYAVIVLGSETRDPDVIKLLSKVK